MEEDAWKAERSWSGVCVLAERRLLQALRCQRDAAGELLRHQPYSLFMCLLQDAYAVCNAYRPVVSASGPVSEHAIEALQTGLVIWTPRLFCVQSERTVQYLLRAERRVLQ